MYLSQPLLLSPSFCLDKSDNQYCGNAIKFTIFEYDVDITEVGNRLCYINFIPLIG